MITPTEKDREIFRKKTGYPYNPNNRTHRRIMRGIISTHLRGNRDRGYYNNCGRVVPRGGYWGK